MELKEILAKARALNKKEQYTEVIALLTDEILAQHENADLYAEKAQAYYNIKDYTQAIKDCDKVIELNPEYAKAYYNRGIAYRATNNYEQAIKDFDKAIELNSKDASAYNNRGIAHRATNNYELAIKDYNKAIELNPEDADAYYNRGIAYNKIKDYEQAIKDYDKAIELNLEYAKAYNNRGIAYRAINNNEQAIKDFDNAIELNSKDAYAYYNRGNTQYDIGDYRSAKENFTQYIKLVNNPKEFYTLQAKDKIEKIEELLKNNSLKEYKEDIKKTVADIKQLLLFNGDSVTHYTGLNTTKKLILNKSPFRLSEGNFLNDTSEGRALFKHLDFHQKPTIDNDDTIATLFATKPFIGSFVAETKHDDLTLWRMYGKEDKDEACGCAITIDRQTFISEIIDTKADDSDIKTGDSYNFYKVAYRLCESDGKHKFIIPDAQQDEEHNLNTLLQQLKEEIDTFKSKEKDTDSDDYRQVTETLNEIAYLFKSAEYQYEHELRLVIDGVGFDKKIDNDDEPKVYIELVEITPFIQKITLGPKVNRVDEWASAFYYALDRDDLSPDILISHLPYK